MKERVEVSAIGHFIAMRALNARWSMLINMTRLVEDSVTISERMIVHFPETDTDVELIGINETLKKFSGKKVYCAENGVIAFIVNGFFYVTPFTGKKLTYLVEKQGFEQADFFVPFSDGGMPRSFENIWKELVDDAENPG